MRWPKKQLSPTTGGAIAAAGLLLPLDTELFQHHLSQLTQAAAEHGGVENHLASLAAKQALYGAALANAQSLRLEEVELLLEQAFTARRKLFPTLAALGEAQTAQAIAQLLHGDGLLAGRMQGFVAGLPIEAGESRASRKDAGKIRRAAWDFAAELLHFSDPLTYPLMTRWVWDKSTMSGALRELVRDNDKMADIPFDNRPEIFETARCWLAEQIAAQGIYREIHFWVDLVLAQAYLSYFRAMAEGNLGGDFGRGSSEAGQLKKLLGIDAARKDGRSRVKKEDVTVH